MMRPNRRNINASRYSIPFIDCTGTGQQFVGRCGTQIACALSNGSTRKDFPYETGRTGHVGKQAVLADDDISCALADNADIRLRVRCHVARQGCSAVQGNLRQQIIAVLKRDAAKGQAVISAIGDQHARQVSLVIHMDGAVRCERPDDQPTAHVVAQVRNEQNAVSNIGQAYPGRNPHPPDGVALQRHLHVGDIDKDSSRCRADMECAAAVDCERTVIGETAIVLVAA